MGRGGDNFFIILPLLFITGTHSSQSYHNWIQLGLLLLFYFFSCTPSYSWTPHSQILLFLPVTPPQNNNHPHSDYTVHNCNTPSTFTITPQSEFITATVPLIVRIIPEVALPPLITGTSPSQSSQLYLSFKDFSNSQHFKHMDLHYLDLDLLIPRQQWNCEEL